MEEGFSSVCGSVWMRGFNQVEEGKYGELGRRGKWRAQRDGKDGFKAP